MKPGIAFLMAVSLACSTPAPDGDDAMAALHSDSVMLRGARLWVDSTSSAWRFFQQTSDATSRAGLRRIAEQPLVPWFTEITPAIRSEVDHLVTRITGAGALPVFVLYAIPQRDCGAYASGGARDSAQYLEWIEGAAAGIGARKVVVLLEPDALMEIGCLNDVQKQARFATIRRAVQVLKRNGSNVYIDAGNPGWVDHATAAERLKQAGIDEADGFTLNISNSIGTPQNTEYGKKISALVGGKYFIIDTSRNGRGRSESAWCNSDDMALGHPPTTNTGDRLVDAYLWVKTPGESDGECNGGPPAGEFWPQAALRIVRNSR